MMKRIIDIPEEIVKAIQNGEDYKYDIHTAIAQGRPYEPKCDLISRNAVIRMFNTMDRYKANKLILQDTDKEFQGNEVFIVDDCYELLDLIGNVDAYPFEQVVELIKLNQQFAEEITNLEKRHGEWIYRGRAVSGLYHNLCPICKQDVISNRTNYCGNCGADMREK